REKEKQRMKDTEPQDPSDIKFYQEESVFKPANLLREAKRQMQIPQGNVPALCVLDPDGDMAAYLRDEKEARKDPYWACYHSTLYDTELNGRSVGVLPCAVGAPYATLVAEQLFASGCECLVSITSSGVVQEEEPPKDFALITEAFRDEGTSDHYLPREEAGLLKARLPKGVRKAGEELPWFPARSWTTDAPYRETPSALEAMKERGANCVEMEAAALYAFAKVEQQDLLCFAHLTNTMAQEEGDFEKGEAFGSHNALNLLEKLIQELEDQNHLS
ncbi:MAG: nucleoside phosphorylase, partial [Flavobacteriales bacterium]